MVTSARAVAVEAVEKRAEQLGLVQDRPHGHVHERRLELLEPGRRRFGGVGYGSHAHDLPARLLPGEAGRREVDVEPAEGAGVRIGLEPLRRATAGPRTRGRLERGERDHRAEGVVHGWKPERGGRDRRRELAAVVDDRVRAPGAREFEQLWKRHGRMSPREDGRESERAPALAAQRQNGVPVRREPLAAFGPGQSCSEELESLVLRPWLPLGGGREDDVVPAGGERVRQRHEWAEMPFPRHAAEEHAHVPIIAVPEEARRIYRLCRDGDLQRAARAGQDRDRRSRRGRGARAPGLGPLRRRARARGMGGRRRPGRRPRSARPTRVADRRPRSRPRARARSLLRRRLALGLRREGAAGARLRERLVTHRRLHRLEAQRLPRRDAPHAHARPAAPLLAPPADPRGRRGGPGAAARRAACC